MYRSRRNHLDSPTFTKISHPLTNKLRAIITDDLSWYPKPSQDIPLYERYYFLISDLNKCLSFNPLGEIIRHCQHKNFSSWSFWQLPHYVHTSFHEWPRGSNRI
ncbi:hypothetical protein HanPI659440_Chr12g0466161 [Helianthus annuus]|nr:hypothetical protein HanPI659440_Chr12g0466161 [Helianthus annuus]